MTLSTGQILSPVETESNPSSLLIRFEVDHGVSGIERFVFRSKFFELLEEVPQSGHTELISEL